MKGEAKVLITGLLEKETIAHLKSCKHYLINYQPDCKRKDLLNKISDYDCLITRSETTIDKETLDHAKQLKIIIRACVGVANIDLNYATEKGILVVNTPGKNTNSAAELTMGLIFSMLRKNMPIKRIKIFIIILLLIISFQIPSLLHF